MKVSEKWLREWVNPALNKEQLADRLTMSGLEVEEMSPSENKKDFIFNISITPNRGDCLSVKGLAIDISATTQTPLHLMTISPVKPISSDVIAVELNAKEECPHYVGRIIRDVKANGQTPEWLKSRLIDAGISCISPVVDVMNYVMLELGQPMHAFDLHQIADKIQIRLAKKDEELKLLDGQNVKLDSETLIIADEKNPLAIAGVMGGLESGVTLLTRDIFLESAYFKPSSIVRSARKYGIISESSYRFERFVDPDLQRDAIERATQLLLDITGGVPGPVIEVTEKKYLPHSSSILLRGSRIKKILGFEIPPQEIESFLNRLQFVFKKNNSDWDVTVPARRSDITLEIDLIEEIARLYGYEKIPTHNAQGAMQIHSQPENKIPLISFRRMLMDLGYNEVITYSFVDKKLQNLFDPENETKALLNPITDEMDVMRTQLWPGLVSALLYNQNRQQERVRLFEIGLRFKKEKDWTQQRVIGGLIYGSAFPEQWGIKKRDVDFFDLKGDLQSLLSLTQAEDEFIFQKGHHPALHQGQTADIYRKNEYVGTIGALHPAICQKLKIEGHVFLFELLVDKLETSRLPVYKEISKFPEIRRDIAILVDQGVPSHHIQDTIVKTAGDLLKDVNVFDVYQGKGISPDRKSIALALTLQHPSRTLKDEEVAEVIGRVIVALKDQFAAELRG